MCRFQSLAIALGTAAKFDTLHHLLEKPSSAAPTTSNSATPSCAGSTPWPSFADRPTYAVLHEAIYAPHASTLLTCETEPGCHLPPPWDHPKRQ